MRLKLIFTLLLLMTLACYSDSPLWPYELTPAPPTVTPLPPAPAGTSRFEVGDLAWLPKTVSAQGFRADLTTYPESANVDNRVACTQDSLLRILYTGQNTDDGMIYHLVDCNRQVGWILEQGILGPITIQVNDRALTLETDTPNSFKVEAADPPYDLTNNFRPQYDCKVNDTVDVIGMTGFSTGELYYKIRCTNPFNPVAPNIGWTTPDKLFGPVRFRNGESGIVPNDVSEIELTPEAGGDEASATCATGERVLITETPVQRIEDELFYEIQCGENTGWVNQNVLVGPVLFEQNDIVLVIAPPQTDAPTPAEIATQEATAEVTEEAPQETVAQVVPLTTEPANIENIAGECMDGVLVEIQEIVGIEDNLYFNVLCGETEGWLSEEFTYGPAKYQIGETAQLGEPAVIGFNERGIYLSIEIKDIEGSSGGSSVIAGECAYDLLAAEPIEAEILDVSYLRNSLLQVSGIFYRIACSDKAGNTVEGWINQNRLGIE